MMRFCLQLIWYCLRFANRDISKIRILVPGAGLGRITYELAYRGYYCEGNEFSLFMLIASNFVLNKCIVENQYTMYPWIHQFVNNLSRKDQVMPVSFPDVSPTKVKPKGGFNMVAGDFLQVNICNNFENLRGAPKYCGILKFLSLLSSAFFFFSGVHNIQLLGLRSNMLFHRLCKQYH